MKARAAIASSLALLASTVFVGTAAAAPPGAGLETVQATCGGQEVTATVTAGATFWVGEQHYLLTSFTGTFTPVEGEPETFTKTYGQRQGLADEITCTGTEEVPGEGTFTFVVTAVPVP
ncbi:hypothetical protein AB0F43_05850 [Kribbella sp. NPDC023972]|uniref:hypothetical protein n=1 Tax=Kribbella sp. NPDC023972 TaxID=3154795 RepID=UPI003403C1BB